MPGGVSHGGTRTSRPAMHLAAAQAAPHPPGATARIASSGAAASGRVTSVISVSPRIDATRLIDFATAVYASAGMPEADARLVADTLVQADLWGHQSHGVLRLGWYLDRLRHGVMH